MTLFPWRKKKEIFTAEETEKILAAIRAAEMRTSGEVRIYIESRCRFVDAIDRAREMFVALKMHETELRNATLIYLATKDRQAAVFGDEGIHQKVGKQYWEEVVLRMLASFRNEKLADGLCTGGQALGEALQQHFPFDRETDKNELPDEIVFGS
jgi:uncharacterized membrane protein